MSGRHYSNLKMRWFQHQSDSYTNLKMQGLIAEHGMEGYGAFWVICELVAQQGKDYAIGGDKGWKRALLVMTKLEGQKLENILSLLAEMNLIDKKALNRGILSVPKMGDYSDDYTKRLRRDTEPTPNKVRVDKSRVDKSREEGKSAEPTTVKFTPKDIESVETLVELIQRRNPAWVMKASKDSWAEDINKIHRIDGRSYEQINFMIRWVQADEFWAKNILSASKLREKFNDLIPKLQSIKKNKQTPNYVA